MFHAKLEEQGLLRFELEILLSSFILDKSFDNSKQEDKLRIERQIFDK